LPVLADGWQQAPMLPAGHNPTGAGPDFFGLEGGRGGGRLSDGEAGALSFNYALLSGKIHWRDRWARGPWRSQVAKPAFPNKLVELFSRTRYKAEHIRRVGGRARLHGRTMTFFCVPSLATPPIEGPRKVEQPRYHRAKNADQRIHTRSRHAHGPELGRGYTV